MDNGGYTMEDITIDPETGEGVLPDGTRWIRRPESDWKRGTESSGIEPSLGERTKAIPPSAVPQDLTGGNSPLTAGKENIKANNLINPVIDCINTAL